MSYKGIPYYVQSQYGMDRERCTGLFRGVRETVRLLDEVPGSPLVANPSLPDRYEMVGYWSGSDETPTELRQPEWKPEMKFTQWIRGIMRDKRAARAKVL